MYKYAEGPVVKALKGGDSVFVESIPIYGDPLSTIPTSVRYITHGGVEEVCDIENNATGAGSVCKMKPLGVAHEERI